MPEYTYLAYQGPHQRVDGRINADSERLAAETLLQRGLQPVAIHLLKDRHSLFGRLARTRPLGPRERATLVRELGDLVASGMAVLSALDLLERQTPSPRSREVIHLLGRSVRGGKSLGEAMETCPRDFSAVHTSLVKAGERAGLLTMVLSQISDLDEREHDLRSRVQAALLYPAITAVVGLGTVLLILNFVIPRLSLIFDEMGQDLPLITRILLSLSDGAQWVWRHGLFFLLGIVLLVYLLPRIEGWMVFRDRILLRLPRLGRVVRALQITRFSGILGSLLRNGVPMVRALRVTANTLDNRSVQHDLERAVVRVSEGERLGEALEKERVLPRVVTGMISVGESTGNLEATLERISASGSRDADRMIKILVGLIEPALILLMGVFVAFIVAAVIIPIFQVNLAL